MVQSIFVLRIHWLESGYFSDESRVCTFRSTQRYVWRSRNCRYNSNYTCKTVKCDGISLLVWGAIRRDGQRNLIQCPPRFGLQEYQQISEKGLPALYTLQMMFMQDRAPCHSSSSTMGYLNRKTVCLLSDWPAQSSSLNISENYINYMTSFGMFSHSSFAKAHS